MIPVNSRRRWSMKAQLVCSAGPRSDWAPLTSEHRAQQPAVVYIVSMIKDIKDDDLDQYKLPTYRPITRTQVFS